MGFLFYFSWKWCMIMLNFFCLNDSPRIHAPVRRRRRENYLAKLCPNWLLATGLWLKKQSLFYYSEKLCFFNKIIDRCYGVFGM